MPKPSGYLKTSYADDSALAYTRLRRLALLGGLAAVTVISMTSGRSTLVVVNLMLMASIGALGLNLLTGVAGIVSLGNAAFLAVGAFTAAAITTSYDAPFVLVLLASIVGGAVVGAAIGVPALRFRGLYLVIATIALHYIVMYLFRRYQISNAGATGFILPVAEVGPFRIRTERHWFFLLGPLVVLLVMGTLNIMRSRYGRAWSAIRDQDIAAELLGVNVTRYKVLIFTLSSAMIGLQGGLYAYYHGVVASEGFPLSLAIQYVAMIVIGGVGSVLGAVLGAVFVIGLPYFLEWLLDIIPSGVPGMGLINENLFAVQNAAYGAAIIGFLLLEPRGLAELWRRVRLYFELWPISRERLAADS